MTHRLILITILFSILFLSCGKEGNNREFSRVIIGISEDVDSFNPLHVFKVNEGYITELIFLSLVKHTWNNESAQIESQPMLAESWQWSPDSASITIDLLPNVYWSDSTLVSIKDIMFSFDLYSDPAVQSRLFGSFENFYTDEDNHVLETKTFEQLGEYKLKINFKKDSKPSLFDIDFPIIPKHIFRDLKREDISTADINFTPVTNGPYKLISWEKDRAITLELNKLSFLAKEQSINEIVFKIIPDYNSRLLQLKKGEIDLIEDVKAEDAVELNDEKNISVSSIEGREYDYIGYSNIDISEFKKNKIKPHKLFGDKFVRQALTHAFNRKEVLDEYLYNYGELAVSPVTPIFKKVQNSKIIPYGFDPLKAKDLLKQSGWTDADKNGILEKNGIEFSFELYLPSGNPRREFAATIMKNNLKSVGIDIKIQYLELGVFIDKLFAKEIDAWMAGWVVPLPIELKMYWYSDLDSAPLNFGSYQNKKIDKILDQLEDVKLETERTSLLMDFQRIIHNDEPATFLYWVDNVVAYNSNIKNISINPLGAIHHCWEWQRAN